METDIRDIVIIGVVTFNPVLEDFKILIDKATEERYEIIVVDNNSQNKAEIKQLCESIRFMENNDNMGIAVALNQIMFIAQNLKYKWVLTLDQDSNFPFEMLRDLFKCTHENVGIVSPIIYDIGGRICIINEYNKEIQEVDKCITSGALTNVSAWKQIDGFDERLFIDSVDFDFCKRLKKNNYTILVNSNVIMEHQLGVYRIKKLGCWKVKYNWHPPVRSYYIIRNMIYLERKHRDEGFIIIILRIMKHFLETLFLFENKYYRCKLILKAFRDGIAMPVVNNNESKF